MRKSFNEEDFDEMNSGDSSDDPVAEIPDLVADKAQIRAQIELEIIS